MKWIPLLNFFSWEMVKYRAGPAVMLASSSFSISCVLFALSVSLARTFLTKTKAAKRKRTALTANPQFVNNPDPLFGRHKWLGGCFTADGDTIVGIPSHSKRAIKLTPSDGSISTFGGPHEGQFKWLRGVLAPNKAIYGIPAHAESVLKITPDENRTEELGHLPPGQWKVVDGSG